VGNHFACGCSEESRAEAASWVREVFPTIPEDDPAFERKISDIEGLLGDLGDKGYSVQVITDQWCAVVATHVDEKGNATDDERYFTCTFDYGMLLHALCNIVLRVRVAGVEGAV
jgi:hypothetical protein